MSIIYNNQVVAGKYTQQVVADADTVNAGIIKLATEEQVIEGVDNTTAVTPFYLAQKQDKISAGDGIVIDNNEISCTVNPDEQTIVRKDNGTMQCIGQLTKSNTLKFDWEGTQAEYNVAYLNGTIQPDWYCYITDDEEFVDYADVCNQSLSNLRPEGEARFDAKLNLNLDNINKEGEKKLNSLVLGKANIDLTNITDIGIQVIKDNSKSFNLFDTILKDHILTYEESKGLALQGTYVYKNAVAGERYGYPDFYNKCLEEYQNNSNIKQWLKSNVTKVGSIVDSQGVLSGFSDANYVTLSSTMPTDSNDWEIVIKYNTGSDVTSTTNQVVFGCVTTNYRLAICVVGSKFSLYLSSNGTSWNLASALKGSYTVLANTDYYIKFSRVNGEKYVLSYSIDGITFSDDITVASTAQVVSDVYCLGRTNATGQYVKGFINLNESYININGGRWWSGVETFTKHPNGHLFYDIVHKTEIDNIFTTTGMAWMYGVDQENERIFLPRNIWFEQMSMDEVGKAVEAGLPSIAHTHILPFPSDTGSGGSGTGFNQSGVKNTTFNIRTQTNTAVNAIYGKSNTVQPNAVKKLLYICVGNTVSQSTITDVVDVTTTENDTIPLGYSTYQKNAQPSLSWLKSEGQWNDGNVYETFYNWSVNKLGEAFANGYIKQVTETFDDYDLVINQDDMTFRLPLLDGSESTISDKFVALTLDASGSSYTAPANGWVYLSRTSTSAGQFVSLSSSVVATKVIASTGSQFLPATLEVKKGDVCTVNYTAPTEGKFRFIYAQGNGSLYFKVANAVQNLQIIDTADLIENYPTKSMVDGQWVSKELKVTETTAIGEYTLDLSDYFPNDGYMYEAWGCVYLSRGDSSGTNTNVHIYDGFGGRKSISHTMADGANFQQNSSTFLLTVDTQRTMGLSISGVNASAFNIYLQKYRRLGTNQ